MENNIDNYNHAINLIERKNMLITGVKKIDNFDSEEFLMDTVMGYLIIKGKDLELLKLDTMQQTVSIKGQVNSMAYIENNKNKEKDTSIINRLFKWWY